MSQVKNFILIAKLNKIRKKKTGIILFGLILSARYVDAKQYHLASFSTSNSTLNTSFCKPIRIQYFIQLCDSRTNEVNVILH